MVHGRKTIKIMKNKKIIYKLPHGYFPGGVLCQVFSDSKRKWVAGQ